MQSSTRGAIPTPEGFHQQTSTGVELGTGRTGFPSPSRIWLRPGWPASSNRPSSRPRSRSRHHSPLPTSAPWTGILRCRQRSAPSPLGASQRPRQCSRATFNINNLHRAALMPRRRLISVPVRNHRTGDDFSRWLFTVVREQARRAGDVGPGFRSHRAGPRRAVQEVRPRHNDPVDTNGAGVHHHRINSGAGACILDGRWARKARRGTG